VEPSVQTPHSGSPTSPAGSPVAYSYADITPDVRPSSVEQVRARRNGKRWRANLAVLVGLLVLAGVGFAAYQAYENQVDDDGETDYSAVCAIDKRSLNYALEAFRGDLGGDANSFDDLVRYGLLTEAPTDWTLIPDPDEPGRTIVAPTPGGRCA
jgi:hypothetical protein